MRILFAILILYATDSWTQELPIHQRTVVEAFIKAVKSKNYCDEVSVQISYPLKRQYPLRSIFDEKQFKYECEIILDAKLRDLIIKSTYKDWSAVGWRGIMFGNGLVWLDYDGMLIAVNYQSAAEKSKREKLIHQIKKQRHPSINSFEEPVVNMSTSKHIITIDDIGNDGYRYASWPLGSKISDKPALVITGGQKVIEGSGGNHTYVFKNGDYRYECQIEIIGEIDSPLAYLVIYLRDKEIVREPAIFEGD